MEHKETGDTAKFAQTMQSSTINSRLVLGLTVVCGVIAVIAVIVAAVSLSRPPATTVNVEGDSSVVNSGSGGSATASVKTSPTGNRIWSIATGHDYGAHAYIDEKGYLQGFDLDLIREVCNAVDIDCRIIWDKYTNCWDSEAGQHSMGGKGLLDGWYDACMAWLPTVGRIHVFSFSDEFAKAPISGFHVKQSDNTFNPKNISGKKIAFVDGWASDEKCVARQSDITGAYIIAENIVHVDSRDQMVDLINTGQVAAGFIAESAFKPYEDFNTIKRVGDDISCVLRGTAVMTRKDNSFIDLWNQGLKKIMANGKYKEICYDKVQKEHSSRGEVYCLDV